MDDCVSKIFSKTFDPASKVLQAWISSDTAINKIMGYVKSRVHDRRAQSHPRYAIWALLWRYFFKNIHT
jgi:ribosomal protein S17E